MAEIVGLVTGIGTIVATAFTIAKTISTVANDLGTAGSQIRAVAVDTKAIAFVLRDLEGRVLKNSRKFNSEAKSVLKDTVALCTSEIENMRAYLMPLFQSVEGRRMDLKQRATWLFAKSRVSTTKASLDSMKVTLGLLLQTIEYIEGDVVEDFIEEDIHEMIATSKGTKEKFLKAQRIDKTVEVLYIRTTSHQTPDVEPDNQPSSPTRSHEQSQVTDGDEVTNHTMDVAIFRWASNGTLPDSESQNIDLDGMLPAEFGQTSLSTEWAVMASLSDESFLQIADHIRLQKMVSGFALDIIAQPEKSKDHFSEGEQASVMSDSAQPIEEGPSDRFPSRVPSFAQTQAPEQQTDSNSGDSLNLGNQSAPKTPHKKAFSPSKRPTPSPMWKSWDTWGEADPELEALKSELAQLKLEKEQMQRVKDRDELERSIRQEAEAAFNQRMSAVRQERVEEREEVMFAKMAAEQEARQQVEKERKAEEEREKMHAAALAKAELEMRQKLEKEAIERRQRQGLRGLFNRSPKS